jgi:hypothetical protein
LGIDGDNRHPADQLSDVRARIKELEQEEAGLRSYLLRHPDDLVGSEYVAIVTYKRVLDMESLRQEVGDAVILCPSRSRRARGGRCLALRR